MLSTETQLNSTDYVEIQIQESICGVIHRQKTSKGNRKR